jgi:hypothetical protein
MTLKKSARNFLTPFLIGFLFKEIVAFISEKGLSGDFPLAKNLFLIIVCLAVLIWLWCSDEIAEIKSHVESLEEKQKGLEKKPVL